VYNQRQSCKKPTVLPFIWVPNNDGTVSKINTETGKELGRYRVAPHSDCSPSRTAVDLQGNCWVGNRQAGTVVKIGLLEAGQWKDRNGNGKPDTSQDLDNDGSITGTEILPWGQDECVLFEVVLIKGKEGTFVPGTYTGEYDKDYWGTAPRGLAVDNKNNLWAGTYRSGSYARYYYINSSTGAILNLPGIDTSPWSHNAYGAVIDRNGILWSAGRAGNNILRLDPSTTPPTISRLDTGHFVYGVSVDYLGHLFASGWDSNKLSRITIPTGTKDWTHNAPSQLRGVVCTADNDVWTASSLEGKVYRYHNDGTFVASIAVGNQPTGVVVDAAGKVWVGNNGDEFIKRIDPATNTVDLAKRIIGSGGHYSYSDMTGTLVGTIAANGLAILMGVYSPFQNEMENIYGNGFILGGQYYLSMSPSIDLLASIGFMDQSGNPNCGYCGDPTFLSDNVPTINMIPMEVGMRYRIAFMKYPSEPRGLYVGAGINYIRVTEKIPDIISAKGSGFGTQIFAVPQIFFRKNIAFEGEVKLLMNKVNMESCDSRYSINLSGLVVRAGLSWYF
jgi:streptogramin lyase